MSSGASEWASKQTNEWAQRQCEWTSEQTSEWPSTLCVNFIVIPLWFRTDWKLDKNIPLSQALGGEWVSEPASERTQRRVSEASEWVNGASEQVSEWASGSLLTDGERQRLTRIETYTQTNPSFFYHLNRENLVFKKKLWLVKYISWIFVHLKAISFVSRNWKENCSLLIDDSFVTATLQQMPQDLQHQSNQSPKGKRWSSVPSPCSDIGWSIKRFHLGFSASSSLPRIKNFGYRNIRQSIIYEQVFMLLGIVKIVNIRH